MPKKTGNCYQKCGKPNRFFLILHKSEKEKGFVLSTFLVGWAITAVVVITVAGAAYRYGADALKSVAVMLTTAIGSLVFYVASYFTSQIATLLSTITTEFAKPEWAITKQGVFLAGWVTTRNLGNMLIVLAVIGIAVATILRFRDYEAKKLLLPILVVAVLINFSNVFVGIIIDTSNILQKTFSAKVHKEMGLVESLIKSRTRALEGSGYTRIEDGGTEGVDKAANGAALSIFYALVMVFIGLTLLYLTIILIVRQIMLGILFILAPLAFVFRVFPLPQTKKLWNEWWENFIKWCFTGTASYFFLYLSTQMIDFFNEENASFAITLFRITTVMMVLLVGLKITRKTALPFAQAAMGLAGSVYSYGKMAAFNPVTKWAADNVGITRAKNAVQYGVTRLGEGLRVVSRGTAAKNWDAKQNSQVDDKKRKERIDALTGSERADMVKSAGNVNTRNGQLDRVAMIKAMARDNQLGTLNVKEREDAMKFIQKFDTNAGDTEKALLKADPDLARFATKSKSELIASGKAKEEKDKDGKVTKTADQVAEGMLIRNNFARLGNQNLKEMSQEDKVAYLKAENEKAKKEGDGARTAMGAQIYEEAVEKKYLHKMGSAEENGGIIAYMDKHYGSTTIQDAKKLDPQYAAYDKEATSKIEEEIEGKINPETGVAFVKDSSEIKKAAQEEAIKRAAEKLNTDKFAELDKGVFEGDLGKALLDGTQKQHIARVMRRGPKVLMDKILNTLEKEITAIEAIPKEDRTEKQKDRRKHFISLRNEARLREEEGGYTDDEEEEWGGDTATTRPKKPKGGGGSDTFVMPKFTPEEERIFEEKRADVFAEDLDDVKFGDDSTPPDEPPSGPTPPTPSPSHPTPPPKPSGGTSDGTTTKLPDAIPVIPDAIPIKPEDLPTATPVASPAASPSTSSPKTPAPAISPKSTRHASIASDDHIDRNEDSRFATEDGSMGGVFDGIGGHPAGDIASAMASDHVRRELEKVPDNASLPETEEAVKSALLGANDAILEAVQKNPGKYSKGKRAMGTTASVVKVWKDKDGKKKAVIGNVGDSRVYVRRANGKLEQVTLDDNLMYDALRHQMQSEIGGLSEEEKDRKVRERVRTLQGKFNNVNSKEELDNEDEKELFGQRNVVSQNLGAKKIKPRMHTIDIGDDEKIIITSDGIHDNLTDKEIEENLNQGNDENLAKKLTNAAKMRSEDALHDRAKTDDITAVVL